MWMGQGQKYKRRALKGCWQWLYERVWMEGMDRYLRSSWVFKQRKAALAKF